MKRLLFCLALLLTFQLNLLASTTKIAVGRDPDFVVVNPTTNTIYSSNSVSGTISVIDGATNETTATVNVGGFPLGIAVNSSTNMVYVALFAGLSSSVTVIDGADNSIVTSILVPGAEFLAVNSTTGVVYAVDSDNTVRVIDGSTNTVVATITLNNVLESIAIDETRNLIYVEQVASRTAPPSVIVIDGSTNTLAQTISVSQGVFLTGLAVDASLNRIYATDSSDLSVFVIDGASRAVLNEIPLPKAADPKFATMGVGHQVVVTDVASNQVFVVNGATQKLDTTLRVELGPWGAATNPVTGRTYVALSQAVYVDVLEP